jgi:hypothetical protein
MHSSDLESELVKELLLQSVPCLRTDNAHAPIPLRPVASPRPGYRQFNPTLTSHAKALYGVIRESNIYAVQDRSWRLTSEPRSTVNHLFEYHPDHGVQWSRLLDEGALHLAVSRAWMSLEDIRLFSWRGNLWGIGALHTTQSNIIAHESSDIVARQVLFRIEEGAIVEHQILQSPINAQFEKNRVPMVLNDSLFLIYSLDPLCIYEYLPDQSLRRVKGHPGVMTR